MYTSDGAFGKVRIAKHTPTSISTALFIPDVCGWHMCNDLYHIERYENPFNKYLILITISGTGSMTINHKEYTLPAGTIALLPRNTGVSYRTPKGGLWEFYWIHPAPSCNAFLDEITKKGIFVSKAGKFHNYIERLEKLITLINEKKPDNELDISMEMSTILHFCAMDLAEKNVSVSLAQKACTYITRNFRNNISLDSIANELYVSTAHLIRAFKKEYGCTPHRYLISYRLSYSIELLKFGNMQIDEVSAAVGFSSSSHYISAFREKYGCTPGQYSE